MKCGIITIIDKKNFGNRLQNYALYYYCKEILNVDTYTLNNEVVFNNRRKFVIKKLRRIIRKIIGNKNNSISKRQENFIEFDKNIKYYKKNITAFTNLKKFDYVIVGSDQVWNPNFGRLSDVDVLKSLKNDKRISYAASFGVDKVENTTNIVKEISKFKSISVREQRGKEIIEELTGRKDVEVLIDPTMLLNSEEWDKVLKKPKNDVPTKYILNYFLGDLSDERKNEIERIAKENNCEIINILDEKDPLYASGPGEFVYLEKNAFLICTDSFHSSVFAILYNRPFIVFDREQKGVQNMGSRIDTLLDKFKLENRRYEGKITEKNLKHDYIEAYRILDNERKKSINFLKKALE